jgi:tRNA A-37 threonylcarbamoyl transferase component Bud32
LLFAICYSPFTIRYSLFTMRDDLQLPSFDGATEWFNQPTSTPPEPKGHPTLVHFWSLNSETAKINLRRISDLRDQRKREGLRVVAIHVTPKGEEISTQSVRDAVDRLNLTEPCALDTKHQLCATFANEQVVVPAYYLFEPAGRLRIHASGEDGPEVVEDQLDEMLADLRIHFPFCPACEIFLDRDALFCAACGLPLILPGAPGAHPYYESHHFASLPTVRLFDPDPLIGRALDGKYELTARLGEGGMSVVYRARRLHIGDEVAVKVLLRKFLKNEAVMARFRREARATAMLHHPNVIAIHDFGEIAEGEAAAFMVMEFVKGTPLRDLLNSEKRFPFERALRLMRGICAGVGAAHRQSVIHRDLKPENIIVVAPDDDYEFETVRVVDFGFAKIATDPDAGPMGSVIGTPFYMSPEQCLGEPLDARSDVYSLGAMFYEILSGNRPFNADTVSGIISQQLAETPPPLSSSLTIPRRLSNTIMSCLAKDPNDRPQTATDLARQLQFL